jgi:3-oxoadipate enol-lactonase
VILHVTGAGAPVVLIHPLGGDHSFWRRIVDRLPGHTIVTCDLPGHGANPVATTALTVHDLAEQLRAALAERGLAPVHVVGWSLGGLVAQDLAATHPEAVRGLVLADTVSTYSADMRATWRERARIARTDGLAGLAEPTMQMWFTPDALDEPYVAEERARFVASDPAGYADACDLLHDADTTELLARITAPTLSVCGAHDTPPFVAAAQRFAADLPDAELVWLSASKHAGALQQPTEFADALRGFLARTGPRGME